MRHFWVRVSPIFISVIFLSVFASGQDFPQAEVFGGYSYLHVDTQGQSTSSLNKQCAILAGGTCPARFQIRPGSNGWNAGGQFNVNRWFGMKAQIAGQYGNILSVKFVTAPPITPSCQFPTSISTICCLGR